LPGLSNDNAITSNAKKESKSHVPNPENSKNKTIHCERKMLFTHFSKHNPKAVLNRKNELQCRREAGSVLQFVRTIGRCIYLPT
jgi:hypothetical protein